MELDEVLRLRRMVRSYDPASPVPEDVLLRLLDAVTRAPSAGHAQGRDVVVLRSPEDRDLFWATARGSAVTEAPAGAPGSAGEDDDWLVGMRTAPLLLLVLSDPGAYARRYAAPDKARAAAERARPAPTASAGQVLADPSDPAGAGAGPAGWEHEVVPWWDVDAGMSALLVLLTAVDAGLGACLFGVPPRRVAAVRAAFGVPPDRRVVGVVSVGTPAPHPRAAERLKRSASLGPRTRPHRPPRRTAADVGHDGRFGTPLS